MPDYPTSVKSFTTKVADQTIDAAHINDLQDEVNAVESGLLNGISHDLTPSTNSTRSLGSSGLRWKEGHFSSLYVNGDAVTAVGSVDYARVSDTETVELAANTKTVLNFTTQEAVSNSSLHSTGTNPSRLTAQSSGMFMVGCGVQLHTALTTNVRVVEMLLNSTTIIARSRTLGGVASSAWGVTMSVLRNLDAADFVEVRVEALGSTARVVGETESSVVKAFWIGKL